jgi:D,D-heptose 1,7-bisphosphate phosphatase
MQNKAIFLDRDGTINEDRQYVHKPDDFVFLPKVPEAICLLRSCGYLIIVVTNQSGVARGYFTIDEVEILNEYMQMQLQKYNAKIDAIYYCPHLSGCLCRKPGTLLFEQAISEYNINSEESYAVGDKLRDIEPGKKLGMRTVLISQENRTIGIADSIFKSLFDFANNLLEENNYVC